MKRSLQIFLGLFGVSAIAIATLHVVLGPAAIPGSIPVNPTMDSEDRFYATLFAAYGVALLWCIRDIQRKSTVVTVSHVVGRDLGGTPERDIPTFAAIAVLLLVAGALRWRHQRGSAH